ncbi:MULTISPECIES: hypothetical protein [unclassified Nonomuraea]|uniref:hypothetical protein n=1 Tax=Nonomuraea sp. NPDC049725 TaxID=3154508 RepID=UPI00341C9FB6
MSHQTVLPTEERTGAEPVDRGSVLDLFDKLGTVVVPVAVGLYALLYMGFESVYDTFGITPEQAGLDQAGILGRLVTTLVVLFLALLPLAGLVVGVAWLFDRVTRGAAGRAIAWAREKPWLAAAVAALLSGCAYWGLLSGLEVTGTPVLVTVVAVALLGFLVPYRLLRARPAGRAGMRVLTSAFVGIGLGFVLVGWMTDGAEDIHANGNGNLVLQLAGFPNQWAAVRDGDGKPVSRERWLVLGQDAGSYVFYDCGRMTTVRRPVEGTILTDVELDPDFTAGGTRPARRCGHALSTPAGSRSPG